MNEDVRWGQAVIDLEGEADAPGQCLWILSDGNSLTQFYKTKQVSLTNMSPDMREEVPVRAT